MPLNSIEELGVREILQSLSDDNLRALADTITLRMITITSRKEAIDAIVTYSDTAFDVLKRRKIKKEYVFKYLHKVGGCVQPNADKALTIRAALQFWGSRVDDSQESQIDHDEMEVEHGIVEVSKPLNSTHIAEKFNADVQHMAEEFVRWFYPLLNACNSAVYPESETFGSHHFWSDCKMRIKTPLSDNSMSGITCAQELRSFLSNMKLYLNPFDNSQGIKGSADPHGLVTLIVGGSVHRGHECLGVFEQMFGLIQDPLSKNNWKIKFTELRLSNKNVESNRLTSA